MTKRTLPADPHAPSIQREHGRPASGHPAAAISIVTALGLAVAATIASSTSSAADLTPWRWLVGLVLVPLSSTLKGAQVLENDTRRRAYEIIREHPGMNFARVAERLEASTGTVQYHLQVLEDAHLIVSERYGKYRRYFPHGTAYPKRRRERLAVLSTASADAVACYLLDNRGATQQEIADALDVSTSTVHHHLSRLEEVDLVQATPCGNRVRYELEAKPDHLVNLLETLPRELRG